MSLVLQEKNIDSSAVYASGKGLHDRNIPLIGIQ